MRAGTPSVPPATPIAAVTHEDPYPYYAGLVARRPLSRDDALGLWVATGAAAVTDVLTSEACRVRPVAEPVPAAIAGSSAGDVFGRLVRMNDGPAHAALKPAVTAALDALAPARVASLARASAIELAGGLAPHRDRAGLDAFAVRLAPSVVARLLGAPPDALPEIVRDAGDFVAGIAPGATQAALARGIAAADALLARGRSLASSGGLVATLARHVPASAADAVVANALGFLSQAYDATAGLIGNTLVALARHPECRDAALPRVVSEVARHDAPVQNTRRFVAADAVIGGQRMKEGDVVLVVLAAANRDPEANPDPARFDVGRSAPRTFTFGVGPHACPGAMLATTIAAAGVETLLAAGLDLDGLGDGVVYRPSANARVPVFAP
jgi:cytochrome P450